MCYWWQVNQIHLLFCCCLVIMSDYICRSVSFSLGPITLVRHLFAYAYVYIDINSRYTET